MFSFKKKVVVFLAFLCLAEGNNIFAQSWGDFYDFGQGLFWGALIDAGRIKYNIANATGKSIQEVYIKSSNSSNWGANLWQSQSLLTTGYYTEAKSDDVGPYDIKVVDTNRSSYIKKNIRITEGLNVTFTERDKDGFLNKLKNGVEDLLGSGSSSSKQNSTPNVPSGSDNWELSREHLSKGQDYLWNNQYNLAIAEFTEAIRLDPPKANIGALTSGIDAYRSRGKAYYANGQYDLAIKDFTEIIKYTPESTSILGERAEAYYANEQYDLAIADYTNIIVLVDGNNIVEKSNSLYGRGKAYYAKGQYDSAIKDYSERIRISTNGFIFNDRGCAYYAKGQYELAISDFAEALRLLPNDQVIATNLNNAKNAAGR